VSTFRGELHPNSQGLYGQLNVQCSNVNFSGTYAPSISGAGATATALNIEKGGTFTMLNGSAVDVQIVGNLVKGNKWIIIYGVTANNFTTFKPAPPTLTYSPNTPNLGNYQVSS
jgi:hypothetical protein